MDPNNLKEAYPKVAPIIPPPKPSLLNSKALLILAEKLF